MGLLTDPVYGSVKWLRLLKRVHGPVSFLCYVGALVWFLMLGHREFNNETYFSENALLPGLVTNEFNAEHSARQFYNEFLQELEDKYDDSNDMPVPWLVAKMSQLYLEVYTHNFTLNYPLGEGQVYKGTNVYGILRAPRTASLEAIVVTAPYRSLASHQKGTAAGIALMLAFAQFARPQIYWAKDIIFLITEHEQLGMQAWLEAYHGIRSDAETFYTSLGSFWKPGVPTVECFKLTNSFQWDADHKKCLNPGKLKGRSGSIQAAINLELHTPKVKYIEVKIEGLNGQLPNLDLVNLVHKLCVKSGIHHSYKNSFSWIRSRDKTEEWLNGILTMLGMVSTQIAGVPNGNHGLFHRFGVEAVTLEGRDVDDPAGIPPKVNALNSANFYRLGIALESTLRSLNNLLERFHQSYFFYLLAGTNRFISIGQYMPSLCLLCIAMVLKALSLWVTVSDPVDDEKHKKNKKSTKSDTYLTEDKKNEETDQYDKDKSKEKKTRSEKDEQSMSMFNISANYLLSHMLGYFVMNSPVMFSNIGAIYYDLPTEVSVYYGLITTSVLLVLFTPLIPRLVRTGPITYEELCLINIMLLLELATVCMSVGMHNFPLGFAIAVLYTPLALVCGVVSECNGIKSLLVIYMRRCMCLVMQPLCVICVGMSLYSRLLFPEEGLLEMFTRGRDASMQAIMFSVIDSLIYGNWVFNMVTTTILPIWIIFWQLLCTPVVVPDIYKIQH